MQPSSPSGSTDETRSSIGVGRVLAYLGRWQVLAAAASVPIIVAAGRGIARGYLPIGDNALIEIRGRDVFTAHHPLLGTWSSASLSAGVDVNHPGPLIFDLVALPVKVVGGGPGIALAVACLNIAMVWTVAAVAHRIGGQRWAGATMVVTASLVWALGSEMLYDPWQPNALVLACLALLMTIWGVLAGHHRLLIVAVLIASFAVQTHLGYVYLAPTLVGAAGLVVVGRAIRDRNSRDGRVLAGALGIGILAWSQPLIEQFTVDRGNLGRLLTADASAEAVTTGFALSTRLVASVVALPPWWGRSGYTTTIPDNTWYPGDDERLVGLVGVGPAALSLAALVGVMVAIGGCLRSDRVVVAGVVTALTTLLLGLVTVAVTPIDVLGISAHRVRWLWPTAAFIAIVLLGSVIQLWSRRSRWAQERTGESIASRSIDPVMVTVGAVVLALSAATLPYHSQPSGPVASAADMEQVSQLVVQIDRLVGRGRVLFDAGGMRFAEPYTAPVMAAMQRFGIPFVVDEEGLVRQMGERRRFDGRADWRVFVREGAEALRPSGEAEQIAFVAGLSDDEFDELVGLRQVVVDRLLSGVDAEPVSLDDEVSRLGAAAWGGEVDLVPILGPASERFIDLQYRWANRAVAVFVEPLRMDLEGS